MSKVRDLMAALEEAGFEGVNFAHTGGGCMAIEIPLAATERACRVCGVAITWSFADQAWEADGPRRMELICEVATTDDENPQPHVAPFDDSRILIVGEDVFSTYDLDHDDHVSGLWYADRYDREGDSVSGEAGIAYTPDTATLIASIRGSLADLEAV